MKQPGPRLYLVTPPAFEPAAFASLLARTLDAAPVAAVRLRMPQGDPAAIARAVAAIAPITRDRDVALLLHGDAALARKLGCDGVHVPPRDVAAARGIFGDAGSVGAGCGRSTDAAMTAAEAGADYVAFGSCVGDEAIEREAVADWALAMVVPCVVGGGLVPDTIADWAATGAEFLAVGRAVWESAAGPEAAIKVLIDGIGQTGIGPTRIGPTRIG